MNITPLKSTVSDNWFYLLDDGGQAILVDPIDSALAISEVEGRGLALRAVVNTHWHPDHVAGDDAVMRRFPQAELWVAGGDAERIEGLVESSISRRLKGGEEVNLGDSKWRVVETPGHTFGHVSLEADRALVCGDTVFGAGVGHCRTGDVRLLFATIRDVVMPLPDETVVYFGHDYRVRNLEFALTVSDDPVTRAALEHARGTAFAPPTVGAEKTYNPFFRVFDPDYVEIVRTHTPEVWTRWSQVAESPAETAFCVLRELRNSW